MKNISEFMYIKNSRKDVNFVGISEKCYKKIFQKIFQKVRKLYKNSEIYIEILKNYIKNFLRKIFIRICSFDISLMCLDSSVISKLFPLIICFTVWYPYEKESKDFVMHIDMYNKKEK